MSLSGKIVLSAATLALVAVGIWTLEANRSRAYSQAPAATQATPTASIPAGQNRMALETSPYLLLHADNPVDWYPWGNEAFERARREDKPIFLSVGYATCYWCHVMERLVFENAAIAAAMNRDFINIKVDREERPDVDDIYMTAVQLLQRRGGWPMSVFLTPTLEPFFGGTYYPPEQFQQLLQGITDAWRTQRAAIDAQAAKIAAAIAQQHSGGGGGTFPELDAIERAVDALAARYDSRYGGFGGAPKFPQPSYLELLLSAHEAKLSYTGIRMVAATLHAMALGGIYDHVGRGFHRYSTDARWAIPHFEKMLYDNAQLLHVYAQAHVLTGDPQFATIADEITAFVARVMTGDDGLFYSALDSETNAQEGKYYAWTPTAVRKLLTPSEYALAAAVYGLEGDANFENMYVLLRDATSADKAASLDIATADLEAQLLPIRDKLLQARLERERPLLDDKAIVAWNGLMIEALAYAGRVLHQPRYVAMAATAATAVLHTLRDRDGRLHHVARHGQAKLAAYLDDYAALTLALVELARADGDDAWLLAARSVADQMIAELWDQAGGGFFYAPASVDHLIVRAKDAYDGAMPSGNSLAVAALAQLAAATNDDLYAAYAAQTLRAFSDTLERQPLALTTMLTALWTYQRLGLPSDIAAPRPAPAIATSADRVSVVARLDEHDGQAHVQVELKIAPEWHVQANPAGFDFLRATALTANDAQGRPALHTVHYPPPLTLAVRSGSQILTLPVYAGTVTLAASLDTPETDLNVAVHVQACNDSGTCLAPADIDVPLRR